MKASKMEVHSTTTVLTNYENYGRKEKKFKILELAADDDEQEMRGMADALEKNSKGKCESRLSVKDEGAADTALIKIGCDYLFITGHSSFHNPRTHQVKQFAQRTMGGIALDPLASALVKAMCGGVANFEFWCCECALSDETKNLQGDEHKRFIQVIDISYMRKLGGRILANEYKKVSSLEYMIYRIHTQVRTSPKINVPIGKLIRFIGLNGAGYYGASDQCMRTFDFDAQHELETEIKKMEDKKVAWKSHWKDKNEADLQNLRDKFESHIEARKCHTIVYAVNTKVLTSPE